MTWHTVTILPLPYIEAESVLTWGHIQDILYPYRLWCQTNLSSEGVLWRNDRNTPEWRTFLFAQTQDAVAFRLAMA